MMWKVVLLVLVIVLAAWVIGARRRSLRDGARSGAAAAPPPGVEPVQMKMLACAHCGVHLPQADALMDAGGRPYCSAAHRLSGTD